MSAMWIGGQGWPAFELMDWPVLAVGSLQEEARRSPADPEMLSSFMGCPRIRSIAGTDFESIAGWISENP